MIRRAAMLMLAGVLPLRALPAQESAQRIGFVVDSARAVPFRSEMEIVAITGDSIQVIGQRTIELVASTYADQPAWLLVERRTGAVAAAESLYVSPQMRPLRWSATVGPASLAMVFARDSVFGATSGPGGRQSVLAPMPSRLIVSTAFLEALLPLLPLSDYWADSVNILGVDQSTMTTVPSELAVIGSDEQTSAWIVALRAPGQTVIMWVDRATGRLRRLQQPLPVHSAALLEYRPTPTTPP